MGDIVEWYRGSIRQGLRSPLEILMIQSTSFCNLDCSYCYLPLRDDKSRFNKALIPHLIAKLEAASLFNPELTILWHAGEPLVLPVAWYREAFELFEKHRPAGVTFTHSLQTNGVLVNDEYARFLLEADVRVGVSLDGPEDLHDSRRKTRQGKGSFKKALAGYRKLQEYGLRPSTIAVLTEPALGRADEIYDFFKELNPIAAGFNVEEIEGLNTRSSLDGPDMQAKVSAFYRRMYARALADPQPLNLREIQDTRMAVLGSMAAPGQGGSTENNPLSIISVDTGGKITTFSPELLQVPGETDRFIFGDVQSIDFTRLWQNNRFVEMWSQIEEGKEKCRAECSYYEFCYGGTPANKLAENGTFASSETMHCRLTKQAVIDVVEAVTIAELTQRREKRLRSKQPGLAPPRNSATGAKRGVPVAPADGIALNARAAPARPTAPAGQQNRTLFPFLGEVCVLAPPERLFMYEGTEPSPFAHDGTPYKEDALVPRGERKPLDRSLAETLRGPSRSAGGMAFIALIDLPPDVKESFFELGRDFASGGRQRIDVGVKQSIREHEEAVEREFMAILDPDRKYHSGIHLGGEIQTGGRPTTTIDLKEGRLLGLHLDSWSRLPADQRNDAPNRICVNIGTVTRNLLFMDLTLTQIVDLMRDSLAANKPMNPTDIGRMFMRANPDYPVLSVEIRPGEAYLAPTDNLIHDGRTKYSEERDIFYTVIGHFDREVVKDFMIR